MMEYLFLNTINQKLPSFALFNGRGDVLCKSRFFDRQEVLIKNLKLFFEKNKIKSEEIKGVLVISGPGSFTASRAGVVLANSFNFLYKVPVLGVKDSEKKLEEIIKENFKKFKKNGTAKVYYNREPNITVKK